MAMNPAAMMKLLQEKKHFEERHPMVFPFLKNELMGEIPEGTIIEMTVTKPGQKPVTANLRVTAEDLRMLQEIKNINANS